MWTDVILASQVFTSDDLKYWNVLRTGLLPRLWSMKTFEYLISISPSTNSMLSADLCMCVDCRIWGRPARRSGQATASCPLWRRWLSQSIPTTTCESALERYSQTKALTSWTSRILQGCLIPLTRHNITPHTWCTASLLHYSQSDCGVPTVFCLCVHVTV